MLGWTSNQLLSMVSPYVRCAMFSQNCSVTTCPSIQLAPVSPTPERRQSAGRPEPYAGTTADGRIVSVRRSPYDGRSGTAERQQTTESSLHDVSGTTTVDGHVRGRNASVPRPATARQNDSRQLSGLCTTTVDGYVGERNASVPRPATVRLVRQNDSRQLSGLCTTTVDGYVGERNANVPRPATVRLVRQNDSRQLSGFCTTTVDGYVRGGNASVPRPATVRLVRQNDSRQLSGFCTTTVDGYVRGGNASVVRAPPPCAWYGRMTADN